MKETMLILASSSPRRRELIKTLGLPVDVVPSEADESVEGGWAPARIVEELSLRKAAAVRNRLAPGRTGIVVGSDTIVVLDGRVLGKPRDGAEAADMLAALQGRTHEVYTGLALADAAADELPGAAGDGGAAERVGDIGRYRIVSAAAGGRPACIVGHTVSKVAFRPMTDAEIGAYVATGEPSDKAGAYGVQGIGSVFVEKIEGDFYSVMGLPLNLLYQALARFGIRPLEK